MFENKRIAIVGGGSWATALAKIVLTNVKEINWFIRRPEVIEEFERTGKNPTYLNSATFDVNNIHFSSDINTIVRDSDILILAIPSPYLEPTLKKIKRSMRQKIVISAVKGMIPEKNQIVTEYIHERFNVPEENLLVIAGPCHAEEIALQRLSYLTIGCIKREIAAKVAPLLQTPYVHTTPSADVIGLEYTSVMKNIYSIAGGICQSLRYGDNFQAVLVSNALQEIEHFTAALSSVHRDIDASGYLGDVLVTAYSKFSRNRQFGQMIGMGYSVKAAQLEMEMVAEGYYGTYCIYKANQRLHVNLPIVDAMYKILYEHKEPTLAIQELTSLLH